MSSSLFFLSRSPEAVESALLACQPATVPVDPLLNGVKLTAQAGAHGDCDGSVVASDFDAVQVATGSSDAEAGGQDRPDACDGVEILRAAVPVSGGGPGRNEQTGLFVVPQGTGADTRLSGELSDAHKELLSGEQLPLDFHLTLPLA